MLKYEPNLEVSLIGPFFIGKFIRRLLPPKDLSLGRRVQTSEDVEQGAFAHTRRADDGDHPSAGDRQVDAAQYLEGPVGRGKVTVDAFGARYLTEPSPLVDNVARFGHPFTACRSSTAGIWSLSQFSCSSMRTAVARAVTLTPGPSP